jgi:hypothetical protein
VRVLLVRRLEPLGVEEILDLMTRVLARARASRIPSPIHLVSVSPFTRQ